MENHNKSIQNKKNGVTLVDSIYKQIDVLQWTENITIINLANKHIVTLDENVKLPPNLVDLDLSHNKLASVPTAVLNLETLKSLNISYNSIIYFDETPNFCDCIERLNISNNLLHGPPYWIWSKLPSKLTKLDLSNNNKITMSLDENYYGELLQYTTLVTDIEIYNCRLNMFTGLMKTFHKAKTLVFGTNDYAYLRSNYLEHIPCSGLDECCDLEKLDVCNTHIYTINTNIDIYKHLIEINLSQNNITSLPNEFCNLESLELCILSYNNIIYLPEDMTKLKKLVCLRMESNKLCMLPENISELEYLKVLDVYDNSLYEVPDTIRSIVQELDVAQNYMDEPTDNDYLEKKQKLRLSISNRENGKKIEAPPSLHNSPNTTDDEELISYMNNVNKENTDASEDRPISSPEDWDSDEYWMPFAPFTIRNSPASIDDSWLFFVKQKMEQGNFCPMDQHTVSITERVKYEKKCNPHVWYVVEGQFDDCSDDDS